MHLVIYSKHIRDVSGVQTFELALIQNLRDKFKITLVYDVADPGKLSEISSLINIERNLGQPIECDVCIFSSTHHAANQIIAKRYVQMHHADPRLWGITPKNDIPGIIHVAVGTSVKESLRDNFGLTAKVIPNLLPLKQIKPVLRFMMASRIAPSKGVERAILLIKKLKESGRLFTFDIYGSGGSMYESVLNKELMGYPEASFRGLSRDVQSFMARSDYVVQLSDSEGFCYSIHEALQIGTPVIVSRWKGVEKVVKDGQNGYILDMDLSNLDINRIYSKPVAEAVDFQYTANTWSNFINSLI